MATPDPTQNAPLPQFNIPPPPSADVLNTNLNTVVPNLSQQIAQARKSPEAIRDTQAKNLQKIAENERAITSSQLAQQEYGASAEANIARQSRERAQQIEQTYQDVRKQYPYPELHPTKDNIPTLTGLFSLIGVIGTAIGGQGRLSAIGALNSMTGMMKGWQQGRQDLWERDKQEFDTNMKKIKAVLDDAKADSDRALKLMAYDVQEAQAYAKSAAVKLNSQVATQILENQGLVKFNEYLNGVVKDYQHAENLAQQERARKEARQDAAAARAEAKKDREAAGFKPTATERDFYFSTMDFRNDMNRLEQKLKDNPGLRQKIDKNQIQGLFAEEMPKLNALLILPKQDPELREFLTDVISIRNKRYKSMSGAAVTATEAARNFGANIQPGMDSSTLLSNIKVGREEANRTLKTRHDYYKGNLPDPNILASQTPTSSAPPQTNDKGWTLEYDANSGKYGYVNPKNRKEFEVYQ